MKKTIKQIAVFFLFVTALAACTGIYENGRELAKAVENKVPQISVDSLKAAIDRGDEFMLIDVRTPAEYAKGNIDIAVSLPRGNLEFMILNNDFWDEIGLYGPLPEDNIVVYSQKGNRGNLAAFSLMKMGFKNVKNLTGGFDAFDPNHEAGPVHEESGGCGD
jgi:rhodanese-related sulfurtransferase